MAGISSRALLKMENKRKFVGQEFTSDLDVNYYEFKYRFHDPQIGRFIQIDPLADKYVYNSTYAYAENKPINGIDLEGLEWFGLPLLGSSNTIVRSPIIEATLETGAKVGRASGELPKTQEHHLAPRQFKNDPVVETARDNGFKFEGAENKMPLEQYSKQTGEGQHGGAHPNYNNEFGKRLADFKEKNPNATSEQTTDFIRNTVKEFKETIQNNPGTKVNDLFKPSPPTPLKDGINMGLPVIVPDKPGSKPDPPKPRDEREIV